MDDGSYEQQHAGAAAINTEPSAALRSGATLFSLLEQLSGYMLIRLPSQILELRRHSVWGVAMSKDRCSTEDVSLLEDELSHEIGPHNDGIG